MLKDEQEKLDSRSPETEAIVPAVTPADLLNVGDVLFNLDGAGSDENKSYRAAMTLRAIQETDMFESVSYTHLHRHIPRFLYLPLLPDKYNPCRVFPLHSASPSNRNGGRCGMWPVAASVGNHIVCFPSPIA